MKKLLIVIAIVSMFSGAAIATVVPTQPTWIMKYCYTLEAVTQLLNSLPPQSAAQAKVLAINSQRSFMGSLSTPYYVWYPR